MSAAPALLRGLAGVAAALAIAAAPRAADRHAAAEKVPAPEKGQVKVVYHLTLGIDEAAKAMRNIRNHLEADPTVKIVVVANGAGIDFLLDDAKDKNGNPFDATVEDLVTHGVEFRVCHNTLVSRHIDPSKLLPEATLVASGMAEAARLQAREGFVYLRP